MIIVTKTLTVAETFSKVTNKFLKIYLKTKLTNKKSRSETTKAFKYRWKIVLFFRTFGQHKMQRAATFPIIPMTSIILPITQYIIISNSLSWLSNIQNTTTQLPGYIAICSGLVSLMDQFYCSIVG